MSLQKRENKVAVKQASTWGTAVAPGAGDGRFALDFSPPSGERKRYRNGDEWGRGTATLDIPTDYVQQSGSLSERMYYEGGHGSVFSAVMGGTETKSTVVAGAIKHTFPMAETLTAPKMFTLAWDVGSQTLGVPTALITGYSLTLRDGALVLTWEYLGDKLAELAANNTYLSSVTYPSDGVGVHRLLGGKCSLNLNSGADFAAGDLQDVSGFTFSVKRNFATTDPVMGTEASPMPYESGEPEVTLELNYPVKSTQNSLITQYYAGTAYKARLLFEGGVIGATAEKYSIKIQLPKLYLQSGPSIQYDTPYPTSLKFRAVKATTAPTGMTGILLPVVDIVDSADRLYVS